jgi:hypothetical protein
VSIQRLNYKSAPDRYERKHFTDGQQMRKKQNHKGPMTRNKSAGQSPHSICNQSGMDLREKGKKKKKEKPRRRMTHGDQLLLIQLLLLGKGFSFFFLVLVLVLLLQKSFPVIWLLLLLCLAPCTTKQSLIYGLSVG